MDIVLDDDLLVAGWNLFLPDLFRAVQFALDDEHPALLEPCQRIRMAEHVGIGGEGHVHIEILAIHADGFGRRREVIGGGLALFL